MVDVGHTPSRVSTPLTGLVSASDTDFPVTSTAGFVVPCVILIGHKDAWHDPTITYVPEIALCTQVVDGTTLRCLLADRGISGTAAKIHDGTTGTLSVTAIYDEWHWERLREELARLDTNLTGHSGAANPHSDSAAKSAFDAHTAGLGHPFRGILRHLSANHSVPHGTENYKVPFDTTVAIGTNDPGGLWTPNADGSITINTAGWYKIICGLQFASDPDGSRRINLRTSTGIGRWVSPGNFGGENLAIEVPTIQLSAGTSVHLDAYQSSGADLNAEATWATYFSIERRA